MAIYKWVGVDLSAQFQKGTMYARSIEALDAQLLTRSIALTRAYPVRTFRATKCTSHETAQFYASMATLLSAGLKVPEALDVVVQTASRFQIASEYDAICVDVVNGARLADACGKNKHLADAPSLAMIIAGESSGTLSAALNANYHRLHAVNEFKSLTRSALLMPLVTVCAFIVLLLFVFLWLVPLMQPFISSFGHQLPVSTRVMVAISVFIGQPIMLLYAAGVAFVTSVLAVAGFRLQSIKNHCEKILLKVPFLGNVLIIRERAIAFDVLRLLHAQGIETIHALSIAHAAIAYRPIADEFQYVQSAVSGGSFMSEACARMTYWYDPEVVGLLLVGERSGALHDSLERIVRLQRAQLAAKLKLISTLVQPLIIAVLGGIIALVIVSIYLPLLQMPNTISGW